MVYIGLKTHPGLYQKLLAMKASDELDRDEFILLVYNLARIKRRDATPIHLIVTGLVEVAWKPSFAHKTYETLKDGIDDCLNRGKIKEAWLLSQQKPLNESLEDAALRISESSKVPFQPETQIYTSLLKELVSAIADWDSEQSMRKRRIYSPKPEAIVSMCERTYKNTETDIMGGLEQSLFESPYWKAILAQYGSVDGQEMQWSTERLKEQFYETYFTDDIPDEWSAADREKSHGRALQFSESVARVKYYNNILYKTTSVLWGPMKPVTCFLDTKPAAIEFPLKATKKIFSIVDAY